MSVDLYHFGSVLLSGRRVAEDHPFEEGDTEISFGDTQADDEGLGWIKVGNTFWGDRILLPGVKKIDLEAQGYVRGRVVKIDGRKYICRLPYIGTKNGDESEWKDAVAATTEDDAVWHWNRQYFWGQDTHGTASSWVCGYIGPLNHDVYAKDVRSLHIGFRPVLEPLPESLQFDGSLIRKPVTLYLPDAVLLCNVRSLTDYDLFVVPDKNDAELGAWGVRISESELAVNREDIVCLTIR